MIGLAISGRVEHDSAKKRQSTLHDDLATQLRCLHSSWLAVSGLKTHSFIKAMWRKRKGGGLGVGLRVGGLMN